MSDEQTNEGSGAGTNKRRGVARTAIEGGLLRVHFSEANVDREYDVHRVPGAEHVNGQIEQMLAYGVAGILQTAYGASSVTDPVAAADAKWNEVVSGSWRPGRNGYTGATAEPDALALAFAEYRTKKGAASMYTAESFDSEYVPFYMQRTGIKSVAAAKREIGRHGEIAAIRARIMAERAGAAAKAAKGSKVPDLL